MICMEISQRINDRVAGDLGDRAFIVPRIVSERGPVIRSLSDQAAGEIVVIDGRTSSSRLMHPLP